MLHLLLTQANCKIHHCTPWNILQDVH